MPHTLERISKASNWFQDKFSRCFDNILQKLYVDTDNKELRKKINNALNNLKQDIMVKQAGIKCCEHGFSPARYLRAISVAELDFVPEKIKPQAQPDYGESDIEHPELFKTLKEWRHQKARELGIAHFQILHQRVLIQIVVCLPDNKTDLRKISGVGGKTIEKYGDDITAIVKSYRKAHGIETVILNPPRVVPEKASSNGDVDGAGGEKGKNVKTNTRQISLDLFSKGLSVARIAEERGLVENTIQNHLATFVEKGELAVEKVISREKQQLIEEKIAAVQKQFAVQKQSGDQGQSGARSGFIKTIKNQLGDACSYGEITLVLAHLRSHAPE